MKYKQSVDLGKSEIEEIAVLVGDYPTDRRSGSSGDASEAQVLRAGMSESRQRQDHHADPGGLSLDDKSRSNVV